METHRGRTCVFGGECVCVCNSRAVLIGTEDRGQEERRRGEEE